MSVCFSGRRVERVARVAIVQRDVYETCMCVSVDGEWNAWLQWQQCNVTCGGGSQRRNRTCVQPLHGGAECPGSDVDWQSCNTHPCPSMYLHIAPTLNIRVYCKVIIPPPLFELVFTAMFSASSAV